MRERDLSLLYLSERLLESLDLSLERYFFSYSLYLLTSFVRSAPAPSSFVAGSGTGASFSIAAASFVVLWVMGRVTSLVVALPGEVAELMADVAPLTELIIGVLAVLSSAGVALEFNSDFATIDLEIR